MTFDDFAKQLVEALQLRPDLVLPNPGGGTSTIVNATPTAVTFRRGKSNIVVATRNLFDAYIHFQGQEVSSLSLKAFRPEVFDSSHRPAGHNCNCTFLFLALGRMGLAGSIEGQGKRGDPFRARFHE